MNSQLLVMSRIKKVWRYCHRIFITSQFRVMLPSCLGGWRNSTWVGERLVDWIRREMEGRKGNRREGKEKKLKETEKGSGN